MPLIGLGLRRDLVDTWRQFETNSAEFSGRPEFIEVTPENWLGLGGKFRRDLDFFAERYPVYAHGLSLSIGGPHPLDWDFIARLKVFLDEYGVVTFSEHLSYCGDDGHLYDLIPIPFTLAAAQRTAERIRQVQDFLGRRIALENVSYYAAPGQEMSELEFISTVLEEADCDLLLDVNNVWVNSVNHGYDPEAFIEQLPPERVAYQHIAGHLVLDDVLIDTHGAPVSSPVWRLLAVATRHIGSRPTLLERDTNLPPLTELLAEMDQVSEVIKGVSVDAMKHQVTGNRRAG